MSHEQFESCISACNDCADACDHCAVACLDEKNAAYMTRCIKLDMDCAAICRLAASYMARGSEQASVICEACAQICEACADECGQHKMDHCQKCAEACRRCAQECRRMSDASAKKAPSKSAAGASAH